MQVADHGNAKLVSDVAKQGHDRIGDHRVKAGDRFVSKKENRPLADGPGDANPLFLAA